jgi:SagB-type dehydrogenase family enzyme
MGETPMEEVTIRVEPNRILLSDDTGATSEVRDPELRSRLLGWLGEARRAPRTFDEPSAAAVAGIAEATQMVPRPSGIATRPETALSGERVALGTCTQESTLGELFSRRRSVRDVGTLSLADLASVVVAVGRITHWGEAPDGYQRTYRSVPSGGGRHPIEIWVGAADVEGLPGGLWAFDPVRCHLVRQGPVPELAWSKASDALDGRRNLPALVLLVAQFERTLSRYPGGASLVWRDAGVVAMALHMQATALSLHSTIMATAGLLPVGPGLRCDVGAVLLGS